MNTTYQVGQVLYAIDNNRFGIIPAQVIEHHVRTSLNGTDNNYFVNIGGSPTKVDLSSLVGPIFDSSKDAGDFLMSKASEKIKKLIIDADNIAEKHFNVDASSEEKGEISQEPESSSEKESVYVDLPDGTRAKLSGGVGLEDFSS
jgi:hypothetical protein